MTVLVLGGYGLIGGEIVRALLARGEDVVALARSAERGQRFIPDATWIGADLRELTEPDAWRPILMGVRAVVNASGALQSGGRDNLDAVQRAAIIALIRACERAGHVRYVQISAPGATPGAATAFMRTKGQADAALAASGLDWTILRPGLVIASEAYGSTSLLRGLAAFPFVQPTTLADAPIQCVDVADVAKATLRALDDPDMTHRAFDLVEDEPRPLGVVALDFRRWLGLRAPAALFAAPAWLAGLIGAGADVAGWLGWRSGFRTTALAVLKDGVRGDPEPWREATGAGFKSLDAILKARPATRQERLFARMQLLFGPALILYALFWLVSGGVALWRHEAAAAVISNEIGPSAAMTAVFGGAALDLLIGLGLLVQSTCRASCYAALALCLVYFALGAALTPALLADPLGPLVKILPTAALAPILAAMANER